MRTNNYAALKKEAFLPRFEAPTTPQVGNATEFAKMQEQMADVQASVRSIANSLKRTPEVPLDTINVQLALPPPAKKKKAKDEPTVVRGQMSLFDVGCDSTIVRPGGTKFTVNETQIKAKEIVRAKVLQCRWCDSRFTHGPARASHEKTHNGPMRGKRALIDTKSVREALSKAAADAKNEKVVKWCLDGLIKEMIKIGKEKGDPAFCKLQGKCKDGRANNSGSLIRQGRSPHFKMRCVSGYDRLMKQYPQFRSDAAEMVADSFNVTSKQVQTWYREQDQIKEKAQSRKNKHQQRERRSKGRFAEAEKDLHVFAEFVQMRKQGKRVGPHWLKRCMQRHVRRVYVATDLHHHTKCIICIVCL